MSKCRRLHQTCPVPFLNWGNSSWTNVELGAAGLIDSTNIDNAIFGTGKFYKEKQDDKTEDIYTNIDEMLSSTLDSKENNYSTLSLFKKSL